MPSKSPIGPLGDILHHIELARVFAEGLNLEDFKDDRRTVYAVVRCLEIISEASRRLPDDLKSRHPQVPWTNIAGAGNVYRHDYEDIADAMVWQTVHNGLGTLHAAVEEELRNG